MRLEAITVCVGYSDLLAYTLPRNKSLFDHWLIVTTPEDTATQRLCEYEGVDCFATEAFRTADGQFRKSAGINAGLSRLDLDGWLLFLDADIALPAPTRRILQTADLDPRCIYGIDRHNIIGFDAWAKHCAAPRLQQEAGVYIHADSYPVATRFAPTDRGGWMPIGFFQLMCPSASGITRYVERGTIENAGSTDMLFAAQWPRSRRCLIPEIIAYHLESEEAEQGANWKGRTTRPFAPGGERRRFDRRRWRRHPLVRHAPKAAPPAVVLLIGWLTGVTVALLIVLALLALVAALLIGQPRPHPYQQ